VGTHRDGLRFTNGQEILLQRLAERQRAAVLSLSSALPEEETDAVADSERGRVRAWFCAGGRSPKEQAAKKRQGLRNNGAIPRSVTMGHVRRGSPNHVQRPCFSFRIPHSGYPQRRDP
jgi:hypothetical protein